MSNSQITHKVKGKNNLPSLLHIQVRHTQCVREEKRREEELLQRVTVISPQTQKDIFPRLSVCSVVVWQNDWQSLPFFQAHHHHHQQQQHHHPNSHNHHTGHRRHHQTPTAAAPLPLPPTTPVRQSPPPPQPPPQNQLLLLLLLVTSCFARISSPLSHSWLCSLRPLPPTKPTLLHQLSPHCQAQPNRRHVGFFPLSRPPELVTQPHAYFQKPQLPHRVFLRTFHSHSLFHQLRATR